MVSVGIHKGTLLRSVTLEYHKLRSHTEHEMVGEIHIWIFSISSQYAAGVFSGVSPVSKKVARMELAEYGRADNTEPRISLCSIQATICF